MSVHRAAWAAVVVGLLLVLAFGVVLFQQTVAVSTAVRDVESVYDPAASQAAQLVTATSDMQRGLSNYMITGLEDDLGPYVNGLRRSDLALQRLEDLLATDPPLSDLTAQIARDRQEWIDRAARPTIDARRTGDVTTALEVFGDPEADAAFVALQADNATLSALIEDRARDAFIVLAERTYVLIIVVLVSILMLLAWLLLNFFLAQRKILAPLDDLRRQIRAVARESEHTRTIAGRGPRELRSLGSDVESLRRQLVAEIDEARSAREALDQKAPVVAAIRAELSAGAVARVPGLEIAGALQPAEGVLAGDWWDSAVLPTGEAAVVVADISGHGAAAGIAAMRLKLAIGHDLNSGLDIDAMAASAAAVFQRHSDRFATVAAVCIDPADGAIRYINAGHHEPLLVDQRGTVRAELGRTGPILSWIGGDWSIGTAELGPGETLLLYSDGLIESHDSDGQELGTEQLHRWLAELPAEQRSPADLVAWLMGAARQRAVDWNRDDVTIVAVQRTGSAPSP